VISSTNLAGDVRPVELVALDASYITLDLLGGVDAINPLMREVLALQMEGAMTLLGGPEATNPLARIVTGWGVSQPSVLDVPPPVQQVIGHTLEVSVVLDPTQEVLLDLLGGVDAINPLARALLALQGETTLELLGGTRAINPLAHASIWYPSQKVKFRKPLPSLRRGENLTGAWIRENWAWVYPTLTQHLGKKMSNSRTRDNIEDHIQAIMAGWIAKDTLGEHLRQGNDVQASVLKIWSYQRACTEIRGWGTDAAMRTLTGAKTHRELELGDSWIPIHAEEPVREHVSGTLGGKGFGVVDFSSPSDITAEDVLVRRSDVDHFREVLRKRGPSRGVEIFEGLLAGKTKAQMAQDYHLRVSEVETVMGRIKKTLCPPQKV